MIILLMGVTGSGKSTVGSELAEKLNIGFIDADDFHPKENIAFMSEGKPLNDEMRKPWLESIAQVIKQHCKAKEDLVLACSALKRSYRNTLFIESKHHVLIYLKGSRDEIESRLQRRTDHFMPSNMLDSQLATLEEPKADENVFDIPLSLSVNQAVSKIISYLEESERKELT